MLIEKPLIYLITNGNLTEANFASESQKTLQTIRTAAENKIDLVQIREKNLPAKLVFELAAKACQITKGSKTRLLVNDRFDIAIAAGADGVHLSSTSLPINKVRQLIPGDHILGVSAHSLYEAKRAKESGANFAVFGPVFETISKPGIGNPKGLRVLSEICESLKPFPIIALGGISGENFESTLKHGASGFASIGFLNNTKNLRKLGAR